jgi:hypothetical protein
MVLFDHVAHDLERIAMDPEKNCLLRNISPSKTKSFIPLFTSDTPTEPAKIMEGCNLHFDTEAAVWIRSGKVSGRTFIERHNEHRKSYELKSVSSHSSQTSTPTTQAKRQVLRSPGSVEDSLTI